MAINKKNKYDIIIAGGGMIGTCLALALAPLNLKIAVIEPVLRNENQQPSFDERSTALSRSSQRMFKAMGIWSDISLSATAIKEIRVSEKGVFGGSKILASEQKVEALGYVIINRIFGSVLQNKLSDFNNIKMFCPGKVIEVNSLVDATEIIIEYGGKTKKLGCSLLVAADGASSSVRDMIGISAKRIDYQQSAIIGNLLTEKPPSQVAFERFTKNGPLALLPLLDDRVGFIWINSNRETKRLLGLEMKVFSRELQSVFGNRLGQFSRIGQLSDYSLSLTKSYSLISKRSALVGNAANGLHPVAAQGFNLGLRDVAALCDCIADVLDRGEKDFGLPKMLNEYYSWRKHDQSKLLHLTDGIVNLFGHKSKSMRFFRSLGLIGFDRVPGIKKIFALHLMGLKGRLPRLSRGIPLA